LICGYLYASAGEGESTTDMVFSGHNLITENGMMLAESKRFVNEMNITELDLDKLIAERRRMSTYLVENDGYVVVPFIMISDAQITLTRFIDKAPFVPGREEERSKRCNEIISIQALGLKKRIKHIGCKHVVIGISGGLDSTLALLIAIKTFDLLGLDRSGIQAVTMPCFGTTDRTYQNAVTLTKELGATLREIRINESVLLHLHDIGHEVTVHDITYENAQARERTQVLMDIANQCNGIVIGTGDMSELALGWATYNGDHMSMYGVNVSIPKTLVRYLVAYFANETGSEKLKKVLLDVLDTPVSPELLPPKEGKIAQKTEDIVGPYELHDFFLFYLLRYGFTPVKIYRLAIYAFGEDYSKDTILKWLKTFYWRFFSQQFKRSCLPDGPKVGSVAVSPRGDLRMPSDASYALWKRELDSIK
jgi:NAD+ synthase (glutamine-hydrolysing)